MRELWFEGERHSSPWLAISDRLSLNVCILYTLGAHVILPFFYFGENRIVWRTNERTTNESINGITNNISHRCGLIPTIYIYIYFSQKIFGSLKSFTHCFFLLAAVSLFQFSPNHFWCFHNVFRTDESSLASHYYLFDADFFSPFVLISQFLLSILLFQSCIFWLSFVWNWFTHFRPLFVYSYNTKTRPLRD